MVFLQLKAIAMTTNTNFFNAAYKNMLTATAGFLMTMGVVATTAPTAQAQSFNPFKIFKKAPTELANPRDGWALYKTTEKPDAFDTQMFYSTVQIPVDPDAPKAPNQFFAPEPVAAHLTDSVSHANAVASIDTALYQPAAAPTDTLIAMPAIGGDAAPIATTTTAAAKQNPMKHYKANKKLSAKQETKRVVAKFIEKNTIEYPCFDPLGFTKKAQDNKAKYRL